MTKLMGTLFWLVTIAMAKPRMIRGFHWPKLGVAALAFAGLTTTSPVASATAGTAIYVSDVEQLYDVLNNCVCEGAAVVLAPGIYPLSPTAPKGGRLELQKDMSLSGVAGDPAKVVIDATALVAASFSGVETFGRTGVIRTGHGSNAVRWLTIAGNPLAAAAIETDLVSTPEVRITVAHVVAVNGARGVDIRNVSLTMAGRRIEATIVDSDFFGSVEGIRIINFNGADSGDISVLMIGNRSYENRLGCIIENNRSSFATIQVRSIGDRFEGNGLGCQIGGGFTQTTGAANSNSTLFEGYGTTFINNTKRTGFCKDCGTPEFTEFGGLLVVGGDAVFAPDTTFSNTVTVRLWGSKVAGNQQTLDPTLPVGIDFQAFGARSGDPSGIAGTHNHATIELHGVSARVEVVEDDSSPDDPSGSNTVSVVRSRIKRPGDR